MLVFHDDHIDAFVRMTDYLNHRHIFEMPHCCNLHHNNNLTVWVFQIGKTGYLSHNFICNLIELAENVYFTRKNMNLPIEFFSVSI